jgi:phosphoglycerate dehydrogenase-like enzyme
MCKLNASLINDTQSKLIQQWGVGLEGVDIDAASQNGVPVCNVPGDATLNADSTAEHAVLLMLALSRNLKQFFKSFNQGPWGDPLGESLFGKTTLIVGLGEVGKALVKKLQGLGMKVLAIKRSPDEALKLDLGLAELGSIADISLMAQKGDFVVSTVSLTIQTRGLLGNTLFESMKPTAFVVNVSRGAVVDETALVKALKENRIAGAGLDVFCEEPLPKDNPLLQLENVFATPHIAGVTLQNYDGICRVVANNIKLVRNGRSPRHCVNADKISINPK